MSIRKPMVLVLAGPNGSGKSTITQYFEKSVNTQTQMILFFQQEWIILKQQNWLMKKDIIQFLIRKVIREQRQCSSSNI